MNRSLNVFTLFSVFSSFSFFFFANNLLSPTRASKKTGKSCAANIEFFSFIYFSFSLLITLIIIFNNLYVCMCVFCFPVYHFFLFPSAGGFTLYNSPSVFRFSFSSTKISTEKSFKFTQKKLPFQHSLTLGLLLCCLSLFCD